MNPPTLAKEAVSAAPLTLGAVYLNFISTYGTAVVTTLAILYALAQFYWRRREHNKIMREDNDEPRK